MLTGQNCLKHHCLMRWVAKMERDGPDAPFDGTPAARRLTAERHSERVAVARNRVWCLTHDGQPRAKGE